MTRMNSTITKKNEEGNYPAHYPSQTFSSNKSICIRNNRLKKQQLGGKCTGLVLGDRRGLPCISAEYKPCQVSYNMSTAKGFPKQACANTSFVSIEMPLSLPVMCQKGHICPLQGRGLSGPSDQERRARGWQMRN